MSFQQELRRLSLKNRNRIRSIFNLDIGEAIKRFNAIRANSSAGEIAQIERVIWSYPSIDGPFIPELFPKKPQTFELFHRLKPISLSSQLQIVEIHARSQLDVIRSFFREAFELDKAILSRNVDEAISRIGAMYSTYGYSHYLLRKAVFIRETVLGDKRNEYVEQFLAECGLERANPLITSLIHCYQNEQDILSVKRSILSLPNRGSANQYTRDMCRVPFQPFAVSADDMCSLIQSAMQSSIIDAVILMKVNKRWIDVSCKISTLQGVWREIDNRPITVNDVVALYDASDQWSEHLFYKGSSAWLDVAGVVSYRKLVDNYFESDDSQWIESKDSIELEVRDWVGDVSLDCLASSECLTAHDNLALSRVEVSGNITRSALVNYCLEKSDGFLKIDESSLISLMGKTRDLNKIISSELASNLARTCASKISKLVLYLLIAKRSKNEKDDHLLRKVLQDICLEKFNGDLVAVLNHLYERNEAVGEYAYDVFTEDFIAKLFSIISTTSQITETRAAIHKWMGGVTGEKGYLDRARTVLIDHQINKVRNELDDNRIYVDVARFHEWFDDEMLREFSAAFNSLKLVGSDIEEFYDSTLIVTIGGCYSVFCSNKVFGIASYLGRRIRHGTFKGHLFSGVTSIERLPKYEALLGCSAVEAAWSEWKASYENRIDMIIKERLHVASSNKRDGLLNPEINSSIKHEIVRACAKAISRDLVEGHGGTSTKQLITEYCWRLAEIDLKNFGAFLKKQRRELINSEVLANIKSSAPLGLEHVASELIREVTRAIDEKLSAMQNWFKKPINVSPRASLPLLFRAVADEVKQAFEHINVSVDVSVENSIELMGGAYHVLYDAFYVVVYNAAKHGKVGGEIVPTFFLELERDGKAKRVVIQISSHLKDGQCEADVCERLKVKDGDDIENAQVYENRSGIPKLYQLEASDANFKIDLIECVNRQVRVCLSYELEH